MYDILWTSINIIYKHYTVCFHVCSISASRKPWVKQHGTQLRWFQADLLDWEVNQSSRFPDSMRCRAGGDPGVELWSRCIRPLLIYDEAVTANEMSWIEIVVINDVNACFWKNVDIVVIFDWQSYLMMFVALFGQHHVQVPSSIYPTAFCCDETQLLTVGYQ